MCKKKKKVDAPQKKKKQNKTTRRCLLPGAAGPGAPGFIGTQGREKFKSSGFTCHWILDGFFFFFNLSESVSPSATAEARNSPSLRALTEGWSNRAGSLGSLWTAVGTAEAEQQPSRALALLAAHLGSSHVVPGLPQERFLCTAGCGPRTESK